jgi:hypothetical protein
LVIIHPRRWIIYKAADVPSSSSSSEVLLPLLLDLGQRHQQRHSHPHTVVVVIRYRHFHCHQQFLGAHHTIMIIKDKVANEDSPVVYWIFYVVEAAPPPPSSTTVRQQFNNKAKVILQLLLRIHQCHQCHCHSRYWRILPPTIMIDTRMYKLHYLPSLPVVVLHI